MQRLSHEERIQKIIEIKKPLNKQEVSPINFSSTQAICVNPNCWAITTPDSATPIIGSYGAGPCLIVVLHDPTTFTVVTHMFAATNPNFLGQFLDYMNPETTIAHLMGGGLMGEIGAFFKKDAPPLSTNLETFQLLTSRNIKIKTIDIGRGDSFGFKVEDATSIAIHARTGEIYAPVSDHNFACKSTTFNKPINEYSISTFITSLKKITSDSLQELQQSSFCYRK